MYEQHWGLSASPFSSDLDPEAFFESSVHEEALARLRFLLDQRRRVGILLGGHGSGKSMLMEVLWQERQRAGLPVARLGLLGVSADEFPWLLASELGLEPSHGEVSASLWRSIADCLAVNRYQQQGTTVLLDDAAEGSHGIPQSIARLAQLDTNGQADLTVILSARTDQRHQLGPRLLEMADLRIDLDAWNADDTAIFLAQALERVGRQNAAFEAQALERLHELSGGNPRRVRQLADLSLLAGAGSEQTQVDAATVEAVHEELGV